MASPPYISEVRLKRDEVESFDRYPFSLAAVRPLERLALHPAVTFFVGENGSGKSTLLEAIALCCGFNSRFSGQSSAPAQIPHGTLAWAGLDSRLCQHE